MGRFVVNVMAVGNHGCQREAKSGDLVTGCGAPNCTDCVTREYVQKMRNIGTSIEIATLTHWPDGDNSIFDNLKTGRRTGSFQ